MFKDVRKNESKGFSLVELIVVIAIMAVMTAVLAPALLQYVEKSRAQKDDSAMGEVVEVVKLALADQDVYDECLCYTVEYNKDSYAVGADETEWDPTGTMRGLTITFHATKNANATKFALASGVVNEFMAEGTTSFNGNDATGATLGSMNSGAGAGQLNGKVQAGIPNGAVDLTSQTYRNSDYTIFIKMGAADEAVVVTGGWNGTNLPAGASGEEEDDEVITFYIRTLNCGTLEYQVEAGTTWHDAIFNGDLNDYPYACCGGDEDDSAYISMSPMFVNPEDYEHWRYCDDPFCGYCETVMVWCNEVIMPTTYYAGFID